MSTMKIIPTKTIDPLFEHCSLMNENTLVVFDVGDVILQTHSRILRHISKPLREQIKKEVFQTSDSLRQTALWSKLLLTEPRRLVDPRLPKLISKMKTQKAKIIALTSIHQGPFGLIPSMEEWRLEMLKSFGIHFADSFDLEEFILEELAPNTEKPAPRFKKGILFSHGLSKGLVLNTFLQKIKFKPEAIILIDDQINNLETIQLICKQQEITFHGYHYLPESSQEKADEAIAKIQLQHLHDHEIWLSEEEVIKMHIDSNGK